MSKIPMDPIVDSMHSVLNRSATRAAMVASNLANLDTPGYKAMDVRFDDALARAGLQPVRTRDTHLSAAGIREGGTVFEAPSLRIRNDGNSVDIDKQMTLLAKMQGRYTTASQLVRKRFGLLIYTITTRS